jgi:hypoxanthine phosphoribosyltransferase
MTTPTAAPGPVRVFDHDRIWRLSTDVFEEGARMLAAYEAAPDAVVGVARGGVPLARFLGGHYGVPVLEVTARHNLSDDIYAEATGIVELAGGSIGDSHPPPGSKLLVADDICGTGATLSAVLSWADEHLRPARLRTTVLCRNHGAGMMPDSWVWDTRDWVVFPWNAMPGELTEPLRLPAQVRRKEQR